jgi:hypothetical protein
LSGLLQRDPFQCTDDPEASTTRQDVALTQEIASRAALSTDAGGLQRDPFQRIVWPLPSIATQDEGPVHEMPLRPDAGSIFRGELQRYPFQRSALPEMSIATQKVLDPHEMPTSAAVSTLAGFVHFVPVHRKALPAESTRKHVLVPAHATSLRRPAGSGLLVDDDPLLTTCTRVPPTTPAQKVWLAQETASGAGAINRGPSQVEPSKVNVSPEKSTPMQKDELTQDRDPMACCGSTE